MSLIYRFAPDALPAFRAMDIGLQEHVLDVLEDLVANPWRLRFDESGIAIFDGEYGSDELRFVFFLNLLRDDQTGMLRILGVGAAERSATGSR